MKYIRIFAAALTMVLATGAFAEDYSTLSQPQPTQSGKKIEVLEFFYYGCPHCFHLHPALARWEKTMPKDVAIEYVPSVLSNDWVPMAYTYYALKEMHKDKLLDDKLYNALNIDGLPLGDLDSIADFISHNGINRQDFIDYFQSFTVDSDVKRARQMGIDYQIGGTPTLIVDGKYVVYNKVNADDTIANLNKVIAMARKARRR